MADPPRIDRGDAIDRAATKGPIDQYLGNYMMTGWLGTYRVNIGQGGLPSDVLINVGIGDGVSLGDAQAEFAAAKGRVRVYSVSSHEIRLRFTK